MRDERHHKPLKLLSQVLEDLPEERTFLRFWMPAEGRCRELTFGAFRDAALGYSDFYERQGLVRGDRLVLILSQGPDLVAAFAGALFSGIVPTILAQPTFKFDADKYRRGLFGLCERLEAPLTLIDGNFPPHLRQKLEVGNYGRLALARRLDSDHPKGRPRAANTAPEDIAFIQHSAGTTGLQKGVALSHRSVLNQLEHLCEALEIGDGDHLISWLPFYHDMGLIACLLLPLVKRLPLVLLSPTDWVLAPGRFLELASQYRCTLSWMPNFAFQFLARRVPEEERGQLELSAFRALINCSEPILMESMEEFAQAFTRCGFRREALQTCYAMAENTFAVTASRIGSRPTRIHVAAEKLAAEGAVEVVAGQGPGSRCLVSSGRPLKQNRLRIVDSEGKEAAPGTVGEIVIGSDSLFSGYYRREECSGEVLKEGWYQSGDLGFLHQEELFVLGRKDDVIIVGGVNLQPHDVERVAWAHSEIRDGRAVAFGLPNDRLGTQDLVLIAEVVKKEALSRAAVLSKKLKQEVLAEIGLPPKVVWIAPPGWIVKSTAGKPARSATREKFLTERRKQTRDG